jgi:hypothetical protein
MDAISRQVPSSWGFEAATHKAQCAEFVRELPVPGTHSHPLEFHIYGSSISYKLMANVGASAKVSRADQHGMAQTGSTVWWEDNENPALQDILKLLAQRSPRGAEISLGDLAKRRSAAKNHDNMLSALEDSATRALFMVSSRSRCTGSASSILNFRGLPSAIAPG